MDDENATTRTSKRGDQRPLVVVAMSGGVDSSVAAALLAREGSRVIGLTLRTCDTPGAIEACDSAARAARRLDIEHLVVDARARFDQRVLRPAWEAYAGGRTPNPCVACNELVKFQLLLQEARLRGAATIATGHYARVQQRADGPRLLRGVDRDKDQSYFLCRLSREQLEMTRLPLGELTKAAVRRIAAEFGLPQAGRPESQDGCIGQRSDLSEVLRRRFSALARPGPLVDASGETLGHHGGIHRFTVGQRRGLGVALGRRAYVAAIDAARDRVLLTTNAETLRRGSLRAVAVRWHIDPPDTPLAAEVQVRYRHRAAAATIERTETDGVLVRFADGQWPRSIAPGQAAVFYREERLLGGGWIAAD